MQHWSWIVGLLVVATAVAVGTWARTHWKRPPIELHLTAASWQLTAVISGVVALLLLPLAAIGVFVMVAVITAT